MTAIRILAVLTVLCGVLYPLAITAAVAMATSIIWPQAASSPRRLTLPRKPSTKPRMKPNGMGSPIKPKRSRRSSGFQRIL